MPPDQPTDARLRRIVVDTSAADWSNALPRPTTPADGPIDAVGEIIADVRARGDAALLDLTARLDGVGLDTVAVSGQQIDDALRRTPPDVVDSLRVAAGRIERFHRHQRRDPVTLAELGSSIVSYETPVDAAGCYVPGGRAAYPSTLLMTAIPARVAGVERVAVCVPASRDTGAVQDVTLAAAAVAGVDEVYSVGGAQAIAALAYGTETIAPVDVVAGPGNMYVATAKALVAGDVGVAAAFAGPSEIVVIADDSVPARFVAIDLMVQAEHGPDGLAWLICADPAVADAVDRELAVLVEASPRAADIRATLEHSGFCVIVDDSAAAVAVANRIAPEHLQLMTRDAAAIVTQVRHAGAIFVGPMSPASLGDYAAGPSHVLPTHGTARFASALTTSDFVRHHHIVTFDAAALDSLGPHVERLALAEGLTAHAQSVRLRLDTGALVEQPTDTTPSGTTSSVARRPARNPSLAAMEGYHSPQLDVAVRLNTNEAPERPPRSLDDAVGKASTGLEWNRYPDRMCTSLREAIAELEGVDPRQVFVANGSNEVLQTLFLAYGGHGRELVSFEPTYALHSHIAQLLGMVVDVVERRDDFTLDVAAAERRIGARRPAVVAVCSPNNPTGLAETRDTVDALVRVTAPDGLTVVDEAYGQFSNWSAVDMVDEDTPLAVVRTFSKTWSMAGLRLGYAIAPSWVVDAAFAAVLPYHLDALKQRVGQAALTGRAEMDRRVARLVEQRSRVAEALATLDVDTWPSSANFILFRPRNRDADEVWSDLVERSVLVRNCASWPRLAGCLRVTIGSAEENDRFLDALGAAVGPNPAPNQRGDQ